MHLPKEVSLSRFTAQRTAFVPFLFVKSKGAAATRFPKGVLSWYRWPIYDKTMLPPRWAQTPAPLLSQFA
jgi:hypothetical protein